VLFRRHVTDNPFCPICSREPESLFNILWQCSSSMAVWQEGCRRVQKLSLEETDGRGFLLQLRARLNGEELLETLTLARLIWLRRNSFIFNRSFSDPGSIISHARDIMSTFTEVHFRSLESAWIAPLTASMGKASVKLEENKLGCSIGDIKQEGWYRTGGVKWCW
jgi:hypothetical protein